jgi:hypothetical protein
MGYTYTVVVGLFIYRRWVTCTVVVGLFVYRRWVKRTLL